MQMIIEDSKRLNFEQFGETFLYRPRYSIELQLRSEAEIYLRAKYSVGKYTDAAKINEIVQYLFSFYIAKLQSLLPSIASRHFLEFLLFQYDQSSQIDSISKEGKLSDSEMRNWKGLGPKTRRAIKYLAECVVMLHPEEEPSAQESKIMDYLDIIWLCAEQMVELYIISDQTVMVFPEKSILEIFPESNSSFFNLSVSINFDLPELVALDTANNSKYLGTPQNSYETNITEHNEILKDSMLKEFGLTYIECLSILWQLINYSEPAPNGFPVLFIDKEYLIKQVTDFNKKPPDLIRKLISGFSISKNEMESEDRQVWKPKQEYRAFRRGFFELQYLNKIHIAFSRSMAKECFIHLCTSAVYQQFPPQWLSPGINSALAIISNRAGKWFEKVVKENLDKLGIIGHSYKKMVGGEKKRINIPPDVGEIDFLGYSVSEKVLFILECKMVLSGTEPKLFRKDIDNFVGKSKSYLMRFRKKYEWVSKNIANISEIFNSSGEYSSKVEPVQIAGGFITNTPNIAMYFINEFPCVSLTNLMLDYDKKGSWPYQQCMKFCE